jgi:GTP cyclohydrolase I
MVHNLEEIAHMSLFEEIEKSFKEKYKGWKGAEQFDGSGKRLERLWDEMCWPQWKVTEELGKHFKAVFNDEYSEMLISGPTDVWVLCPHHILPCLFKVHIGYIPNGKVLGLSKFSRIAITLGKRPIMQETYSRELAEAFMKRLQPEGVGIYIIGKHGCIGCRGVNQDVEIKTCVLKGSFLEDPDVKEEFLKGVI